MQTTLHHIQLADTIHHERSNRRLDAATRERGPTLRARVGTRLIGLGERLANGRAATATR